jgi:hypothetical protein
MLEEMLAMPGTTAEPLDGFKVVGGTFWVSATDFKIVHRWSRSELIGYDESPEFALTVTGAAVAKERVCVIGTTEYVRKFGLVLRSTTKAKERWEWHRAHDISIGNEADTPERRINNRRNEILDRSPPTAMLWAQLTSAGHVSGDWDLECQIPDAVLERLAGDVTARRVNTISIGIEWVAGLVKHLLLGAGTTWGLFKLSDDGSPEPLWGHVTSITWTESAAHPSDRQIVSEKLGDVCEEWTKAFAKKCEEEKDQLWRRRTASVLGLMAKTITSNNADSAGNLSCKLDQASEFLQRLDEALHQQKGPFNDEKYFLWAHRNLGNLMRKSKPSRREHFADTIELSNLATEYLANPWLHNPYLDWVLVDSIAGASTVQSLEAYMNQKHGMSYALFEGVPWKMSLWKLVMWPLAFIAAWILPAIGFYYIAIDWSASAGIGMSLLYYGLGVLGLTRWVLFRLSHLLSSRPTPRQQLSRLIEEAERAYEFLAGPVLHVGTVRAAFERAAANGVNWNQQIFYILDRLAAQPPNLWENYIRRSGVEVHGWEFA